MTRRFWSRRTAMFVLTIFSVSLLSATAGAHWFFRPLEVLFIRHSEADPPDGPLSELGLEQAAGLAELLRDKRVISVDTSMLTRAFETGAAVATDQDLTLLADALINEVSFDLEGVPPELIRDTVVALLLEWLNGKNRDMGIGETGETFNDVMDRWDTWWRSFVRENRRRRGTAVVVAHGALLLTMLPETCRNALEPEFILFENPLVNTAIVKTRLNRNGKLTCIEWAGAPVPSAHRRKR